MKKQTTLSILIVLLMTALFFSCATDPAAAGNEGSTPDPINGKWVISKESNGNVMKTILTISNTNTLVYQRTSTSSLSSSVVTSEPITFQLKGEELIIKDTGSLASIKFPATMVVDNNGTKETKRIEISLSPKWKVKLSGDKNTLTTTTYAHKGIVYDPVYEDYTRVK